MNINNINIKKIALIILFILAIIIFGLLIYVFFFKPAPPTPISVTEGLGGEGQLVLSDEDLVISTKDGDVTVGLTPSGNITTQTQVSPFARGGLTHVTTMYDNPTEGLTLGVNGSDLLFHNSFDNKFYKMTLDGKMSLMNDRRFYDVDNVAFNSPKNKAIVEYPDGANIYFNFTTGEQVTLPSHWQEFEFSPKAETLAFKNIGLNAENNWLVLSNPDGSGADFSTHLANNYDDVDINWSPDNKIVATYVDITSEYGAGTSQELIFLGQNKENFKSIIVEGIMYEGQWSKTGDRLFYSVVSGESEWKPEVWMVNAQGNAAGSGRRNLKLETWSHKCAFASNIEVYCAVPTKMEEGYGLVPEVAKDVPDRIYKVNLNTGMKTVVAEPDDNYTVGKIIISEDGKYLYFIDQNTGKLHKINL